ncbi:MAG: hypothetical protein ACK5KO_07595, partial [Arachnia sp.]
LLGVELTGHVMTVNLTGAAFEGIEPGPQAMAAARQVAYTVSDLIGDPELRVRFLVDGGPPPEAFRSTEGFGLDALNPMPAVWIRTPRNDATLDNGDVLIAGMVKADAEVPVVSIVDATGEEVLNANPQIATLADENGWRSWTVVTDLAPGDYVISAESAAAADGTGARSVETKRITVH